MIIKNMRWCYDGGGIACGPCEGAVNTEITYLDQNENIKFILVSNLVGFLQIRISSFSMIDIMTYMIDLSNEALERSLSNLDNITEKMYEVEIFNEEEWQFAEEDDNLVRFAIAVSENYDGDSCSAARFIEEYIDEKLEDIDLSLV